MSYTDIFAGTHKPIDTKSTSYPDVANPTPYADEPGRSSPLHKSMFTKYSAVDGNGDDLPSQIRRLFMQARYKRRPIVAQWNQNYRILRNRVWGNRAPWLPKPEVPEIYPIIAALVGWMTDQRPTFEVVAASQPHSPYHDFFAKVAADLKLTMQSVWQIHGYEEQTELVVWDGFTYGTGIFKTGWDMGLDGGMGNAILTRIDPYTFYPDPAATSMKDANYFIEVRTMSLQEMERRWPGSLKKVGDSGSMWVEDIDKAPDMDGTSNQAKANPGAMYGSTASSYGRPGQGRSTIQAIEDPGVTVFEAWLREHQAYADSDGNLHVDENWRVVIIAGNCVIMDEQADDLWGHARHPYVRYVPHATGEFWGFSLVEMLTPAQLSINYLLAAIEQNIWLIGNPVFIEDTRAGIQRTRITNKPGQRITKNAGADAKWMDPPQMHPQMSHQLVTFYIQEMERISGLSAITRGMVPGGRNAEGVMDSVQESAFVRVRLALRNLEWSLRDCGELIASNIIEFYTTPRIIAAVGPSGEGTSLALKSKHFYLPTESGSAPMRYQLLVQAGSAMPTSRQSRIAEADTMFALGAIDDQALLEAHDFPNRDKILERVKALKASGMHNPPGARQRARK